MASQPAPEYLQGAIVALDNQTAGVLVLVGGRDHFLVTHRPARLDHGPDARRGRGVDAIAEGEEGVRGHGATRYGEARFLGLEASDLRRNHAAHLAGAHADGAAVAGIHDGVGFHVLGD